MRIKLAAITLLLTLISCGDKQKKQVDVSNIAMDAEIVRFEEKMYGKSELPDLEKITKLRAEFPLFFDPQMPDSIYVKKMNFEQNQALYKEVKGVFPNLDKQKKEIVELFKHVKYYYPKFKAPKVITTFSDYDYTSNVIYADSLLFVSLDIYLGKSSPVYEGVPPYIVENFEASRMPVDIAKEFALRLNPMRKNRTFIEKMVSKGKVMYALELLVPNSTDAQKIGYSEEKLAWTEANELPIWKYFVQNDLIYSTDSELPNRFLNDAPFSKFYLETDAESPGRIGEWVGWQIVRSYMKNNDVTLHQLFLTDEDEIFKKSKYKPKK
ncbi:gliding motility lipoprotein GldB [Aureivirga sp. CE67]|uniref:gliding motility lipoprotein GldB n=1 Tax=Aureivirga sp. CE67 TaxID=1788983 RepID=UPI0018CBDFD6|nr:gliding motility lipoprotein GldB [Aureivirga sp. CE67]